MDTRRARALKKGEGWAALAACPHCGYPVRFFIQARRAVCLVSVEHSAFLGRVVAVPGESAVSDAGTVGPLTTCTDVSPVGSPMDDDTATASAVVDMTMPPAAADAFPRERGFDDDEAPTP